MRRYPPRLKCGEVLPGLPLADSDPGTDARHASMSAGRLSAA